MISHEALLFSLFLIFFGAAVFSTVALYTRQSMLVAYMLLGILLGPWGFKLVGNLSSIQNIGDIGIIFLLFLLGLHLQPQSLLHLLKKVSWVGIVSSLIFLVIGFGIGKLFHYTLIESLVIGAAMMFSSTIIGLKLLPTTVLHHQHTGELMIGVLLLQDLIAIVVLLLLQGASTDNLTIFRLSFIALSLPTLILFAFLFERYILFKLFKRFDRIHEYLFLIAIGWCLGMAELARLLGLSSEIGAFIAGVSVAASPIALYIAESLKPVRDFFLVLFFFSIGASFNLNSLSVVIMPALLLAVIIMLIKPVVFAMLFKQVKEPSYVAWELGVRLGQVSEFSLLVAYLAASNALIDDAASNLIQAVTILTFIASSYWVVMRYPTPIALSERLRRD